MTGPSPVFPCRLSRVPEVAGQELVPSQGQEENGLSDLWDADLFGNFRERAREEAEKTTWTCSSAGSSRGLASERFRSTPAPQRAFPFVSESLERRHFKMPPLLIFFQRQGKAGGRPVGPLVTKSQWYAEDRD